MPTAQSFLLMAKHNRAHCRWMMPLAGLRIVRRCGSALLDVQPLICTVASIRKQIAILLATSI